MAIEEGLFWAADGERLFYRFQRGSPEKNIILLLHGHGEHSGRYLKFFDRLADLRVPMAVFDLRGCGRSSGERVYVSRFEDYLSDVSSFVRFLGLRYGVDTPIQLFGHSLGGLIAIAWADANLNLVSKLILSSPLLGLPRERGIKILVRVCNRIFPKGVVRNPVNPPFLTHDPAEVEKYRNDPLIQRMITVRLVHEMLRYISIFREKEIRFPFPVYILMAEEDFVVVPSATRKLFSRLQAPHKELESFPGFFHEIFNEKEQEKVFERLRHYLMQ